ncbi:MotA/TolQ/ExbB proton channel family protein [candidate division FCPU426 bacterium]|nr:MotA/TolQ/ExbB proton channel family protein [candidate division FCPU426 bacterium]
MKTEKRFRMAVFVCLVMAWGLPAGAAELYTAMEKTRQDIKAATQELNALREEHSRERVEFAKAVAALEAQVVPLRKRQEALQDLTWQKETGFQHLEQDVAYLKEETVFCASLLTEYRREMAARMSMAETQHWAARLRALDEGFSSGRAEKVLGGIGDFLALVEKKHLANYGGNIFAAQAVDLRGVMHEGTMVRLGPIEYFLSQDRHTAGLAGLKLGSMHTTLVSRVNPGVVNALLQGQETEVGLDLTLGEAVKVERQKKSWLAHIRSGGIVMVPILGLGLVCLVTAIWKVISLRRLQGQSDPSLQRILVLVNSGRLAEAKIVAQRLGEPQGPVLQEGIEHCHAAREELEEIMHEKILVQMPFLEKYLSLLAVSAAAAPLLGLLGTVTGMVHTFDLVAVFGTGKVNILSSGISEALVTTEYGLIVAIPTLLTHAYLSRKVKRIIHTLEQTTVAFINGLQRRKKKKTG